MLPWGHAAVGYLLYSFALRRRGRRPESPEVFLLGFGTLFPDLVDKPLAWTFGVLESGRSLGHSFLIALLVVGVLYLVAAPRFGRSKVMAFGVGYLSHPIADLPIADVVRGDLEFTTYLAWPLLPLPPSDETGLTIVGVLLNYDPGVPEAIGAALTVVAIRQWHVDGKPGWAAIRKLIAR